MFLDHLAVPVHDLAESERFYVQALQTLDVSFIQEVDGWRGFGQAGRPQLWLGQRETVTPLHVGFRADSREQVRHFHAAALAAGATDRHPPGVLAAYHPDFYAAMVYDPNGHLIEVVCHQPSDSV